MLTFTSLLGIGIRAANFNGVTFDSARLKQIAFNLRIEYNPTLALRKRAMEQNPHLTKVLRKRQKRFLEELGNGVALLIAPPKTQRNSDVQHVYRPDSNIGYLSGFEEPNCILLWNPQGEYPFQIFVQPRDPHLELWEGSIAGAEKAKKMTGADKAYASEPVRAFENAFIEALQTADALYYAIGQNGEWDKRVLQLLAQARRKRGRTGQPQWALFDPQSLLGEMRLFKDPLEIALMRKGANLSATAHVAAMRMTRPGMYEYEIEALLEHSFRIQGAQHLAYPSIVATGANACILHYTDNRARCQDGELILIDAGAELDGYDADITRTFPVGSRFSPPQRLVYETVLKAQIECIGLVRPGTTLEAIHQHASRSLLEGCRRIQALGKTKTSVLDPAFKQLYPHRTGHWLGRDVHDVGLYLDARTQKPRKLEPGMIFTIEPGLYFNQHSPARRFAGIGVRIEDDILVTQKGAEVLTNAVPKSVEEIEALRNQT